MTVAPYKQLRHHGTTCTEHVVIAERVLGRPLPVGAVVHHMDENPRNNTLGNLVICPSQAYHMLLHRRTRAMRECGNPNWLRCQFCKRHDAPEVITTARKGTYHKACRAKYVRERTAIKGGGRRAA